MLLWKCLMYHRHLQLSCVIYIGRHEQLNQHRDRWPPFQNFFFEGNLSKVVVVVITNQNEHKSWIKKSSTWSVLSIFPCLSGHIPMNATYKPAGGTTLAEWKCAPKHPHSKACKCTRSQQVDMTVGECAIPCNECAAFVQKESTSCLS